MPDVPRFISSRLAKRREGGVSACTGSSVERFIGQRPVGGWALGGECAGSRLRQVQRKVSELVGRTARAGEQLRVSSARKVSGYQPVGCGRVASSGPRAQTGPLARRPHPRSYGSRCPPCGRAGPRRTPGRPHVGTGHPGRHRSGPRPQSGGVLTPVVVTGEAANRYLKEELLWLISTLTP